MSAQAIILYNEFENSSIKITTMSSRGQWVEVSSSVWFIRLLKLQIYINGALCILLYSVLHDDDIEWTHFRSYWPFVRWPVDSPHRKPVTRSVDVLFDLRPNKQLSKNSRRRWFETPWRLSWRHCNVTICRSSPDNLKKGKLEAEIPYIFSWTFWGI